MTQIEDLIKSSSNDLEALQGILDGVKDSMEDLRKEYESGKKDVNEYNAAMLKLQRVYDQVIDAQKKCIKQQKQEEEALEKQNKKFKDVETSARRYGATLNTALSTISSMIKETNPVLSTALGSVQKLIPNLVDCLGQFQKLTKSAKAAGVEITTFGKLMKVAMSPSGILLVITAVVELISYLKQMNKEVSVTTKAIDLAKGYTLQMAEDANAAKANFLKLYTAYTTAVANGNVEEFLTNYRKELDATGLSIKSVADAETFFIKNTENFTNAINAKANAERIEKEILDGYNKVSKETLNAKATVEKAQTKYEEDNWWWSLPKFLGIDKRNLNKAKETFDEIDKLGDDLNKKLSGPRQAELNEAWEEYYAALKGIGLPKVGSETVDLGSGINIDWKEFYVLLDEARETIMWDIDNQIDLLDAETERAQRALLQKKKEEFSAFWDEYTKNATYKIKQGIWNEDYLGGVDNTEVDELDPYADVLLPKITDAEQAMYDARLENYSNFLSSYADLTDSISGMISDNLDAELEAGKISEAEYKRRTKVLQAFQISSIVANTASGIVDVWKAYATERIGNAEAAVATGPAAPATLAALNAKSLTSAILQTATLSAAGVAGIASVRSGNLSGTSVTPSAGISSTPTITYTQNQGSNQDVVDAINNNTIQSMQQQVVLVVDDLNKVQSNATKVSVQSSF